MKWYRFTAKVLVIIMLITSISIQDSSWILQTYAEGVNTTYVASSSNTVPNEKEYKVASRSDANEKITASSSNASKGNFEWEDCVDGYEITMNAAAGALPVGTEIRVNVIKVDDMDKYIQNSDIDGMVILDQFMLNFDFLYNDQSVEPNDKITVTISGYNDYLESELTAYTIKDEKLDFMETEVERDEDCKATFQIESSGQYGVCWVQFITLFSISQTKPVVTIVPDIVVGNGAGKFKLTDHGIHGEPIQSTKTIHYTEVTLNTEFEVTANEFHYTSHINDPVPGMWVCYTVYATKDNSKYDYYLPGYQGNGDFNCCGYGGAYVINEDETITMKNFDYGDENGELLVRIFVPKYEWDGTGSSIEVAELETLYDAWYYIKGKTAQKYLVSFRDSAPNPIKNLKSQVVKYGKAATPPFVTAPKGYYLTWDKPYDKIMNHTVINAVWNPIQYRIKYELNGGVNATSNPTSYNVTDTFSIQRPTRPNYQFTGWKWPDGKVKNYINRGTTGDLLLTATWKPNRYNVKVVYTDEFGKTTEEMQSIEYGGNAKVKTKENGCTITWTPRYQNITQSQTIYGVCTPIKYEIKYQGVENANNQGNPNFYDVTQTVKLKAPQKQGYLFSRWVDEAGSINNIIKAGSTGTKTFTAKWVKSHNDDSDDDYDQGTWNGIKDNYQTAKDSVLNLFETIRKEMENKYNCHWKDGKLYYGDETLATGWQTVGGNRYYIDSNGYPLKGCQMIDDQQYYFTLDGLNVTKEEFLNEIAVKTKDWVKKVRYDTEGKPPVNLLNISSPLLDCSAFVLSVLNTYGFDIPVSETRSAHDLSNYGEKVKEFSSMNELILDDFTEFQVGDIFCFDYEGKDPVRYDHVGIYIGDGVIAHSLNARINGVFTDFKQKGLSYKEENMPSESYYNDPKRILVKRPPQLK